MKLKGVALLTLALVVATSASAQTKLDQIKKAGKIVLGTSADFPPYEFHTQIKGKDAIVGFDISVATQIAKDLGVKLEIKDMGFDGLLAALQAGKIDFILAGMTPTDERRKAVDFSQIYYVAKQGIIVRAADKAKYTSFESFKDAIVGAQKGAIQPGLVKTTLKGVKKEDVDKPHPQVKELGKVGDLVLELKFKKIDAVAVEWNVAEAYVTKNPELCLTSLVLAADDGAAVAVKKGAPELVAAIDATLTRLANAKAVERFVAEANELVE